MGDRKSRRRDQPLARHVAARHFGVRPRETTIDPSGVVGHLLTAATYARDLWNQQSYLARQIAASPERGVVDRGTVPLAHLVDTGGPDAAAITVETDASGTIRPALYVRHQGSVTEHLLPPHPLHDFETDDHRRVLQAALADVLRT